MVRVQRLRVYSGLRRRLQCRRARRAGRPAEAQLPQNEFRGWRCHAGQTGSSASGARAGRVTGMASQPWEGPVEVERNESGKKKGPLRPWLVDVVIDE